MSRNRRLVSKRGAPLGALVVAMMTGPSARADWPMARHDATRTGASAGTSDFASPRVAWKTYLGGALARGSYAVPIPLRVADVDRDGALEVLVVAGGQLSALRLDGTLAWASGPRGLAKIDAIADLDGDGALEVVAETLDHVVVFAGANGARLWTEPDGEMGRISGVRVADVTGDAKPEIVVEECGCCAPNSGKTGFAHSFAGGFAANGPIWALPVIGCSAAAALTIFDADADGVPEVLAAAIDRLLALDGPTAATLATTASLGAWTSASECVPSDLDGAPGDELVCIQSSDQAPDARRVYALRLTKGAAPSLDVVWTRVLAPPRGALDYLPPVHDLDGDGSPELVISSRDEAGAWSTLVLDARTGVELGAIPGRRLAGVAKLDGAKGATIVASDASGVEGHRWDPAAIPTLSRVFAIAGVAAVTEADTTLALVSHLGARLVTTDLDGDGIGEIVTTSTTGAAKITAWDASGAAPFARGELAMANGTTPAWIWSVPTAKAGARSLAILGDDGALTLLDERFVRARGLVEGGLPVGGHYAAGAWRDLSHTPVVARLGDAAAASVLVPDSRGALVRFDGADAALHVAPTRSWERTHTLAANVVAGLDGAAPGVACLHAVEPLASPPSWEARVLAADGRVLATSALGGAPLGDVVAARRGATGAPALVVQWGAPGDLLLHTEAFASGGGAPLWSSVPFDPGAGRIPAGLSATDWNGDGVDDLVFQGRATLVLDGASGDELARGGPDDAYYLVTPHDLDGDGEQEVTLHGGFRAARAYRHDLSTLVFAGANDDQPYPYGAIARCDDGPVLVEAALNHPAVLRTTRLFGAALGTSTTVTLAGGTLFSAGAAPPPGTFLGALGATNVHADLRGDGRPVAVVGSSDGHLYAVDPCAGSLVFAKAFPSAVGEAVFGDTDGDGRDEIVVTAADGYLYVLRNDGLAPPTDVIDLAAAGGATDVDSVDATDRLRGAWTRSASASGYEVAIVDVSQRPLGAPTWHDVGDVDEAEVSGLPLVDGARYRFVVRATGPGGPSVDVASDGVTANAPVVAPDAGADASVDALADASEDATHEAAPPADDPSAGGGCGCEVPRRDGGSASAWLAALGALVVAARARRPRRLALTGAPARGTRSA